MDARSKVMYCGCTNHGQDLLHGTGMRVHNQTRQNQPPKDRSYRCTVCENVKGKVAKE